MPGTGKHRATMACDFCRTKRTKCDCKMPACSNCLASNTTCTYKIKAKKRGLPQGYILSLEAQVLAFQVLLHRMCLPTADGGAGLQATVALLMHPDIFIGVEASVTSWTASPEGRAFSDLVRLNKDSLAGAKSATKLAWLGTKQEPHEGVALPVRPPPVRPPQQDYKAGSPDGLHTLASLAPGPLLPMGPDTTPKMKGGFLSPGADLDSFIDLNYDMLRDDIFGFTPEDAAPEEPPVALQYHGLLQHMLGFLRATIQQYASGGLGANPFRVGTIFNVLLASMASRAQGTLRVPMDIFRFPLHGRKLVEAYFAVYHPWLPMLDRVQIFRHVARLPEYAQSTPDLQVCSVIALLWAITALAADSAQALQHARNAVVALENAPVASIETIQAMIILGLYFYNTGDWDNAWVLVLSASRMAIDVRLMRPSSKAPAGHAQALANFDNTTRERTWAAVYAINTLLAARMGRSPLVRASDWPTPQVSDDGWEEWESWKAWAGPPHELEAGRCLLVFNEFLKVAALLNSALTCTIATAPDKPHTLAHFHTQLAAWAQLLPPLCTPHPAQLPMVAYTHLCRHMVWCVLAVRLLHVKDDGDMARAVVETRNAEYTAACTAIKDILLLDCAAMLPSYPFVDHFVLMLFNFPQMLTLNPLAAASHTSAVAGFLEQLLAHSVPFKITWLLYQIDNNVKKEDPAAAAKEKSPDAFHLFNNSSFSTVPRFDYKPDLAKRFSTYNQHAPKDELDLFMLDTDFAKTDLRLDKFMRNLGFVGDKNALHLLLALLNRADEPAFSPDPEK